MMLRLVIPTALDSVALEGELSTAGLPTVAYICDGDLVLADLAEGDRSAAQPVVDDHEAAQVDIRARRDAESANESTIREHANWALQANRDFLALASPTNAQTLAQVKALTRQSNGLIRLVLNRLDGID